MDKNYEVYELMKTDTTLRDQEYKYRHLYEYNEHGDRYVLIDSFHSSKAAQDEARKKSGRYIRYKKGKFYREPTIDELFYEHYYHNFVPSIIV